MCVEVKNVRGAHSAHGYFASCKHQAQCPDWTAAFVGAMPQRRGAQPRAEPGADVDDRESPGDCAGDSADDEYTCETGREQQEAGLETEDCELGAVGAGVPAAAELTTADKGDSI